MTMTMSADAKFWDGIAEKYAAQPVENVPAFERKKQITKERLAPDQTIFEIGCGTGTLSLEVAAHVAHVHAVDISGEMVRIARGKAEAQGVDNVTFHQGTLDDVRFEPGTFAGVLAFSILHLVDDLPGTLATLHELTEPGGFFVASTVVLGGSWTPYGLILPLMRFFGKAPKVAILRHEALERAIAGAGFVDVERIDVGGGPQNSFIVARKPSGRGR